MKENQAGRLFPAAFPKDGQHHCPTLLLGTQVDRPPEQLGLLTVEGEHHHHLTLPGGLETACT